MVRQIAITGAKSSITEDDIQHVETETEITLPTEYRAFLLQHNGGTPVKACFDSKDGKLTSYVKFFAPIHNDDEDDYNLQREIEGITQYRYIPSDMIPIAIDPVENRLVLVVSGRDVGKVFYWAWDEEPATPTCSRKCMRLVADSFDELLDSLH